ncbi:TonB-dependent siderophore receptor [Rhodoferax sp. OV413]|uniref:TonB-dependent siderophore receptor n=1 Tax=Rhodoferax sp. OV413 TaxID=1855285 RepID=UPI0008887013|nr:TonB-dependent receptor [Rhodoferax sp. OV413]SDN94240.1 TonB-dependent siderophore receptor [Rhodoferax sp. OV413]
MSPSRSARQRLFAISPLALAVHAAVFSAATLALPAWSAEQAQTSAVAKSYQIPAGPLASVLARFAGAAGAALSFDPAIAKDLQSPGLQGSYTVHAGFAALLTGSGLEALDRGNGEYTLRKYEPKAVAAPAAAAAAVSLPAVTVKAMVDKASTEGTGAYTARVASSATKLNLSLRETPQSVTVITSQMIEDKGLTTMEQVLNHTPGVSMVGDASENSQIFVRGFYMDTGIQVDGLNATSAQPVYEGSISQGLDPAIADRVEVIKGAAGIVAGLGEPSAAVNFIRKRPTDTFQAHVQTSVGSWDRDSVEGDISGPLTEDGRIRGRLVGAYRHANSFMDRYGSDKSVVYGALEVDLTRQTLLSLALDQQRSDTDGAYNYNSNPAFYLDGGIFNSRRSFSAGQEWTYWNVQQRTFTPKLEHRFDNGWKAVASARIARADIDRVSFYPGEYVDRASGTLVGAWNDAYADRSLRKSDTNSVDAYATGPFSLLGRKHELVVGMSQGRNKFDMATFQSATMAPYSVSSGTVAQPAISSTASYDNGYDQQQIGAFSTARLNLADDWKLMVGGRFSNWKYTTTDRINSSAATVQHKNIFTPYLGLVYDLNSSTSLYASYTGIFKPVTYYGASGKLLDPTEGRNIEAGVKWAFFEDRLNASMAVYETLQDKYAEYANQGKLPSGEWIYRSIDGVKTTGFEVEVSGRLAPGWEVGGGFTHNTAKDATGARKNTYIPDNLFKLSVNHSMDRLNLGASLRWQSATYYDTAIYAASPTIAVRQEQKAYTLLDLMARYRFNDTWSVTGNLNNVFDTVYNRSMWGYADYGTPRNFSISLRADW